MVPFSNRSHEIKPEDVEKMMEGKHDMMEKAFANMNGEEIGSMIHEVMPNLAGLNLFRRRELVTTVTELVAIAKAASIGLRKP